MSDFSEQMKSELKNPIPRGQVVIRLMYSLLFLFIYAFVETVIQFCVFLQFIYLFITGTYHDSIRNVTNQAATYAYKIFRYITLNDSQPPFPFSDFPDAIEAPEGDPFSE